MAGGVSETAGSAKCGKGMKWDFPWAVVQQCQKVLLSWCQEQAVLQAGKWICI
jgi:hypothetical protein